MLIQRIADTIVDELYRQSKLHSDAADAPTVWDEPSSDFIGVDGSINVTKLARTVADLFEGEGEDQ
jgi:hypothetical protein